MNTPQKLPDSPNGYSFRYRMPQQEEPSENYTQVTSHKRSPRKGVLQVRKPHAFARADCEPTRVRLPEKRPLNNDQASTRSEKMGDKRCGAALVVTSCARSPILVFCVLACVSTRSRDAQRLARPHQALQSVRKRTQTQRNVGSIRARNQGF